MDDQQKLAILHEIVEEDCDVDEVFNENSSSSDEDVEIAKLILNKYYSRRKRICIKNYKEVIQNYSDEEFIKHFRLNREQVKQLISGYTISPMYMDLVKYENSRAFKISPEHCILVFLWYAGHHAASFRDVADRFDICIKSLHDIISRVCDYWGSLASQLIHWPNAEEILITKECYQNRKGFPNVVGAMDGSHIKIDKPSDRHTDYFNRKSFYSIVLQGVCNHQKLFISIFIGFPGSTHDARIFKCSTLFEKLEQLHNDFYILADSAYGLSSYVITPYRDNGHLTAAQKYFNQKLSSCRVDIEHTFGLLKQRFRQLYHIKLRGHERICKFIRACCVLHNIGSLEDFQIFNNEELVIDEQPDRIPAEINNAPGNVTRNNLCQQLYAARQQM